MSGESAFRRKEGWSERIFIAAIVGLTIWFYTWTVRPEPAGELIGPENRGYYNLLTRGFLRGQLALDTPVDPVLATLKNPYDPAERGGHGLHDASYYKGKFYLYFGVTPALVLFVPFRLLTGVFIDESLASLIFASGGLIAMVGLLRALRRRYFPTASAAVFLGAVSALGLANMMPALLRRASIWEVPITGAHVCAVLGLAAIFRALHSPARATWLAAGSVALGAAVGGRPVYLLGCAALLGPLIFWGKAGGWRTARWRRAAWAAVGPAALIGAAMAWYNWARFGSPFQFGQSYQMSADGAKPVFFSPSYLWYGLRLYWWEPAGWSPFFPFVTVIVPPPPPAGQLGVENPYGILTNMPYAVLALGLLSVAWGEIREQSSEVRGKLLTWTGAALALAGLTMITVMSFGGITNRYMVDFLPVLVVLAGAGWLALATRGWWRGYRAGLGGVLTFGLLLYSAGFNVLVSLQHNGLFQVEHPALYHKVARAANWVSELYDRAKGTRYGPVEMEVIFPRGRVGHVEPLVVTGRSFRSDYLFVHYLGDDLIRFGYEHTSYGGKVGSAVAIKPGVKYKLTIDMGSLYPPVAHPYFDGMGEVQSRVRQRMIRVTLDGVEAFRRYAELYDGVSHRPDVGTSAGRPGFSEAFSGQLLSWRIAPEAAPTATVEEYGPMGLKLMLPPFTGPRSEPLVCSGATGRGDLVYIKYEDAQTVVFGYDHWGVGGFESEPVKVTPDQEIDLIIDYGALHPPGAPGPRNVMVQVDGKKVLDKPGQFYAVPSDSVAVGTNPIGASTASAAFTGVVRQQQRLLER